MLGFLSKIKIVHKINISFGIVVFMVFVLVAFSYSGMKDLKGIFNDYRSQARESLILANLYEDLGDARIAVLKYRLTGDNKMREGVASNVQEIVDARAQINEVVLDKRHKDILLGLEGEAKKYGEIFRRASEKQGERHVVVAELERVGPKLRKDLSEIMETAYRDSDPVAAYYAGRSQQHLMLMRLYAQKFLLRNDLEDVARTKREGEAALKEMESLMSELQNPTRRELAKNVIEGLGEYKRAFLEAARIIGERNKLYFEGLDVVGPNILEGYDTLFEEVQEKQNLLGPQAVSSMNAVSRNSIIVGAFIGFLAAICAFLIGRFVQSNFAIIIKQMQRLSGGDNSFEIEGTNKGGEIGDISKALQVFRNNSLEVERLEEEQKKSEAKQAQERKKATMEMAAQFEERVGGVVSNVEKAATDMQNMANSLSSAVQETNNQSGSVTTVSQQASENVHTVASAAEEMSASIKEISRNVSDTADAAKNCANVAEVSQNNLLQLQNAVAEIDSVIQAINEVAEQTNLLALNATIEAARAGEAGKGFAVVANEVKALANETHKMTDEISKKVEDIKGSADGTIDSVNSIIGQISTVDSKTSEVVGAIDQQNNATSEISRNAQEAAAGTQQVYTSIEEVKKVADDSANSTERLKGAANDLAGQASSLKEAVEDFLNEVRSS